MCTKCGSHASSSSSLPAALGLAFVVLLLLGAGAPLLLWLGALLLTLASAFCSLASIAAILAAWSSTEEALWRLAAMHLRAS